MLSIELCGVYVFKTSSFEGVFAGAVIRCWMMTWNGGGRKLHSPLVIVGMRVRSGVRSDVVVPIKFEHVSVFCGGDSFNSTRFGIYKDLCYPWFKYNLFNSYYAMFVHLIRVVF